MTNIPTDLLRTFVAVVDLRSFTKAGQSLGLTQPAVSAQIKRLQYLLGAELFDRSTQGVSLTPQGSLVVGYARRMLSINDQIVHIGGTKSRSELIIRVGTPSDYVASMLPNILGRFRKNWPDVQFIVRAHSHELLARELRSGELDIFVGLSMTPQPDARYGWPDETVWVRGPSTRLDPSRPVPLVSYGEQRVYHQAAVKALTDAGREWESAFIGPSMTSLYAAVLAGLGVMAIIRRRAVDSGMIIWEDAPLPKLRDLYCGVYIRESGERAAYEQLADEIAMALNPLARSRKVWTAA